MNQNRTNRKAGRRGGGRAVMAMGASALALSTAMATAGTASADAVTPVQGAPAPGWTGTPGDEKCVVRGPDGSPVIFELDGPQLEDGEHAVVDRLAPVRDGVEPGWGGPGGDRVEPAPGPGCDGAPAPGPDGVVRAR